MSSLVRTGNYIILFKYNRQTDKQLDEHAFVYLSDYTDPSGTYDFMGAIIDNRPTTQLRALEWKDIHCVSACR